ncbi:putative relative of woc [Operophtera brumata]|uniref:Putative relative of woc n=1 Tax=Operophtera brumata TaxID=104452 RepID=A0A0L7LHZ5_OPEBR|nr:putative relative of woc [Operophtera brumata]
MKLKKPKDDNDDVAVVEDPTPLAPQAEIIEADLYKRSYFGPDIPTLELECWEEELSESQLAAYKYADEEYKSIQNKLDEMVKDTGGKIVYNGDQFTAYQLLGKQPVLKDLERQSADIIRSRSRSIVVTNVRPSEVTAIGGLLTGSAAKTIATVDLTKEDAAGKTFPSLVVVARPYLRSKDAPPPSDRSALDSKVKSVLMHTPMKFTDSIFEGATFPPSVLLKLVYHWSCQTNVQNVVQWVKVDNLYVKGLFTWLRAVCTSAIHQHLGLMGGTGKKVEIRLRAVEPLAEHEKNYKKRFQKILEPLHSWNVHQSSSHNEGKNSNGNIMEYLRRIVPRMFQNTLSLLSRQIIQQFLDELVWREKFGVSPGLAFDHIVAHIAEQTKLDTKDAITVRLNKIAANPFKNWKYPTGKGKKAQEEEVVEPTTTRGKRSRAKKKEPSPSIKKEAKPKEPEPMVSMEKYYFGKTGVLFRPQCPKCHQEFNENISLLDHLVTHIVPVAPSTPHDAPVAQCVYCTARFASDGELQLHLKHNHPADTKSPDLFTYACLICELVTHILPVAPSTPHDAPVAQCVYCTARFASDGELQLHLKRNHPADTKSPDLFTYACLICELVTHIVPVAPSTPHDAPVAQCVYCMARFGSDGELQLHLKDNHPADTKSPDLAASCDYRVSSHRALVRHFRIQHARTGDLLCVHCLKIRDHITVENATPLCVEEHLVTKPRNKARPPVKDSANHDIKDTFEDLTLVLPDGMICREGTTSCTKCSYATSCYRAMLQHSGCCAGPLSLEDAPRDAPYTTHYFIVK